MRSNVGLNSCTSSGGNDEVDQMTLYRESAGLALHHDHDFTQDVTMSRIGFHTPFSVPPMAIYMKCLIIVILYYMYCGLLKHPSMILPLIQCCSDCSVSPR